MLAATIYIGLFGVLHVRLADQKITRFRTQKTGSLLAYLAYYPETRHPRELLISMFWPDASPAMGRQSLSTALSSLRSTLDPNGDLIPAPLTGDRFAVSLGAEVWTDIAEFRRLLAEASAATDIPVKADLLARAVQLHQPRLASGYYEDWIGPEQEHLNTQCIRALADLARIAQSQGDPAQAREYRRRASVIDSVLAGDFFRNDANPVRDEAVPASFRTQTKSPAPTPAPLPSAPVPPPVVPTSPLIPQPLTRFFGREPELARLESLLSGLAARRLVTITGIGGSGKTRLSLEFVARLQAAEGAERRAHTVEGSPNLHRRVTSLALCKTPDDLLHALEGALLGSEPVHDEEQDPVVRLVAAVRRRYGSAHCLLLLDDFDALLTGGGTPLLEAVLHGLPSLHCLVTSRRRLGIAGETVLQIDPLPVPMPDAIEDALYQTDAEARDRYATREPAIALFLDRARLVRPDFALTARAFHDIVELIRQIDGIPLGIELAAARTHVLSTGAILRQLRHSADVRPYPLEQSSASPLMGRPPSSLSDIVRWSWDILPPTVRASLAMFSVFHSSFTMPAAAAVTGESEQTVADWLGVLCDAALVSRDRFHHDEEEERFRLYSPVRSFAEAMLPEMLSEKEHGALLIRLGHFFLPLVSRDTRRQSGPNEQGWLDMVAREYENLSTTLAELSEHADAEAARLALDLASGLYRFWMVRGPLREGRAQLLRILERRDAIAGTVGGTRAVATALNRVGILAMVAGDSAPARRFYEESLSLHRNLPGSAEDIRGTAAVLNNLAILCSEAHEEEEASRLYQESLEIWRTLGESGNVAHVLGNLGAIALDTGDAAGAIRLLQEALTLTRAGGDRRGEGVLLRNIGEAAYLLRRFAAAEAYCRASLAPLNALGDARGCAYSLLILSLILDASENRMEADALRQTALQYYRSTGVGLPAFFQRQVPSAPWMRTFAAGAEVSVSYATQSTLSLARTFQTDAAPPGLGVE